MNTPAEKKSPILLFGANGQVGFECIEQFQNANLPMIALDRQAVDLTEIEQIKGAIERYRPVLVINAAAYTAVDKAEFEPELAGKVNYLAVAAMAKACHALDIPLFHISTDYVFDGTKEGAYLETDPVNPQSVYGKTKLQGEQALQQILDKHIILRTSWVFGRHGNNFVKTMLRLGTEREELGVVVDQRGGPTYAGDIAGTLLKLALNYLQESNLPWGLYHYGGIPACNWYEFAHAIFSKARELGIPLLVNKVNAISTSDYPTPAKRPANSVLECAKIAESGFDIEPSSWAERLNDLLSQLFAARR